LPKGGSSGCEGNFRTYTESDEKGFTVKQAGRGVREFLSQGDSRIMANGKQLKLKLGIGKSKEKLGRMKLLTRIKKIK